MFPRHPMNREELEELIAKAKVAGVPCPALEAKLASREYNQPWEEETFEIDIVFCDRDRLNRRFPEDNFQIPIVKCSRELRN